MVLHGAYGDGRALGAPSRGVRDSSRCPANPVFRPTVTGTAHGVRPDRRRHRRGRAAGDHGPLTDGNVYAFGPTASGCGVTSTGRARRSVRVRGGHGRPQQGRPARADLRYLRSLAERGGQIVISDTARSSPTPGCPTRERTATASASPPRRRSATRPGTAARDRVATFDHGVDVYTVPGSGTGCLPWPTGRGNLLRNGTGSGDGALSYGAVWCRVDDLGELVSDCCELGLRCSGGRPGALRTP